MEWQDISTAPNDGAEVLLACRFDDGSYQLHVGSKWGPGWGTSGYRSYQPLINPEPTHWMPLPKPPTNEAPPKERPKVADRV